MRHRWAHRKLGRKTEHRIATLRNLAIALFEHERVETTMGKAKELRPFAERLISRARQDSVHARRLAVRHLRTRENVQHLFDNIAPRFADRPGGYTRILRAMPRQGDGAEMAIIELVVRKEKEVEKKKEPEAKKGGLSGLARRMRRRDTEQK
ncbi:MAG: 50S ribosomal protein L17 [Acidobacteria bacterium]|nr:50S ribosomal protein L17 [Acidobacteriota bacterium]